MATTIKATKQAACAYHLCTEGGEPACDHAGIIPVRYVRMSQRGNAAAGADVATRLTVCSSCARALRGEDYTEERAAGWLVVE